MNKRGDAVGENILMMYRLVLITIIAFIVLGISSFVYSYDINVRSVEAPLIARQIMLCVGDQQTFSPLDLQSDLVRYNVLEACGISGDLSRVYANVTFYDTSAFPFLTLEHGDSGSLWVKDIVRTAGDAYDEFTPGYYNRAFTVLYPDGDYTLNTPQGEGYELGTVRVEVLVHADV